MRYLNTAVVAAVSVLTTSMSYAEHQGGQSYGYMTSRMEDVSYLLPLILDCFKLNFEVGHMQLIKLAEEMDSTLFPSTSLTIAVNIDGKEMDNGPQIPSHLEGKLSYSYGAPAIQITQSKKPQFSRPLAISNEYPNYMKGLSNLAFSMKWAKAVYRGYPVSFIWVHIGGHEAKSSLALLPGVTRDYFKYKPDVPAPTDFEFRDLIKRAIRNSWDLTWQGNDEMRYRDILSIWEVVLRENRQKKEHKQKFRIIKEAVKPSEKFAVRASVLLPIPSAELNESRRLGSKVLFTTKATYDNFGSDTYPESTPTCKHSERKTVKAAGFRIAFSPEQDTTLAIYDDKNEGEIDKVDIDLVTFGSSLYETALKTWQKAGYKILNDSVLNSFSVPEYQPVLGTCKIPEYETAPGDYVEESSSESSDSSEDENTNSCILF